MARAENFSGAVKSNIVYKERTAAIGTKRLLDMTINDVLLRKRSRLLSGYRFSPIAEGVSVVKTEFAGLSDSLLWKTEPKASAFIG